MVILPIAYIGHKAEDAKAEAAEAELKDAVRKAQDKADEIEKAKKNKSNRITLTSLGTFLSGINYTKAEGGLFVTNVSARIGVLCVIGTAQNPETKDVAVSIAGCQEVTPYSSAHLSVDFAGSDLSNTCPKSNCLLTFKEAPEAKE